MPDQIGPITELPTSEGPSLPYDLKLRVDVERAIQRSLTVASMGPRSIERGNFDTDALHDTVTLLQWGRVQLNAETRT
ncbi:MAG TPA: hypothetical protein VI958_12510, partial [Acidobacteriota bacterium]